MGIHLHPRNIFSGASVICEARSTAYFGDSNLGVGQLQIVESCVNWVSVDGNGFQLTYPEISLHAVSKDHERFPSDCLYMMVEDTSLDISDNEDANSDDDNNDPEASFSEFRFVPEDASKLESIYTAMCNCQVLHPDEDDSIEEEEGDDEAVEPDFEGIHGPQWFTAETEFSEELLTGQGRAVLARLMGESDMVPVTGEGEVATNGHHMNGDVDGEDGMDAEDQFDDAA